MATVQHEETVIESQRLETARQLLALRETLLEQTQTPPPLTSNPYWGVGPITNMTADGVQSRLLMRQFSLWSQETFPKEDVTGRRVGGYSQGDLEQVMHRGTPADQIVKAMMGKIGQYFQIPNPMAVGLGGGHTGHDVAELHLISPDDPTQHVFFDTPRPEVPSEHRKGFFRGSWASQALGLQQAYKLDSRRFHFSENEGVVPTPEELNRMGVKLFIGVGNETTSATTYNTQDVRNLIDWVNQDPKNHQVCIDGTSMLGATPWPEDLRKQAMEKFNIFFPFQKAASGVPGYFALSLTPQAQELIERNTNSPERFHISRATRISVPEEADLPVTGQRTLSRGPVYNPQRDEMQGGVINSFSTFAFAQTLYNIIQLEKRVGDVDELNRRSSLNQGIIEEQVRRKPLFEMGVEDETRRSTSVTLLKVNDPDLTDEERDKVVQCSKQLLGYKGALHPNGHLEKGNDTAQFINKYPGTNGDYRFWAGGTRTQEDVVALLENIEHAYKKAKIIHIEERLAKEHGIHFERPEQVVESAPRIPPVKLPVLETLEDKIAFMSACADAKKEAEHNPDEQMKLEARYGKLFNATAEQVMKAFTRDVSTEGPTRARL